MENTLKTRYHTNSPPCLGDPEGPSGVGGGNKVISSVLIKSIDDRTSLLLHAETVILANFDVFFFFLQILCYGYINFFGEHAFGNDFDRKYGDLLFLDSGF